MGKKVKIAYENPLVMDGIHVSGLCSDEHDLIMICLDDNYTEEKILSTLSHEAAHFVIKTSGMRSLLDIDGDEKEEALVECIEKNFFPLFNFNRRKWRKKIEIELED